MILLKIQIPCPSCATQPGREHDSQPNHCRKCGGIGYLRSTITQRQLRNLGDIPTVLGASIAIAPRKPRKQARK